MTEELDDIPQGDADGEPEERKGRRWRRILALFGLLLALAVAIAWFSREDVVHNVIVSQLEKYDLPASYKLRSVTASRQVIEDLVIGDRARPDLTIERVEIRTGLSFGLPRITGVTLVRPRLYGTYKDGKLSFGSLDKALFERESKEPPRLPDLELVLDDARARIDGDMGTVGLKAAGSGNLRGGFAGELAAIAPHLALGDCGARAASLYGRISVTAARPTFAGPLRLARLTCAQDGIDLKDARLAIDAEAGPVLDRGKAELVLATGVGRWGATRIAGLGGKAGLTFRDDLVTARYDLSARAPAAPQVAAGELSAKGILRMADGFARIETEGTLSGSAVRPGPAFDEGLVAMQQAGSDSLAAPLLARLRAALARQASGSWLAGSYVLRKGAKGVNLVLPQASLAGRSGEVLLALSRFQVVAGEGGAPRLAGNFSTGGEGIPRITGRVGEGRGGAMQVRMAMAEYAAGKDRLALPELVISQEANGTIGLAGRALLGGALPGGSVEALDLPIDGRWLPGNVFEIGRACRTVSFARLAYSDLALEHQHVEICPGAGGAMFRDGPGGITLSARVPALALAGRLGSSPLRLTGGPLTITGSGYLSLAGAEVTLGGGKDPTRLKLGALTAIFGAGVDGGIGGTFEGGEGSISEVPLQMTEASGEWGYGNGKLSITGASLRLLDRAQVARFEPLVAHDARLDLAEGRITAEGVLREPASDREVTRVDIAHELSSGAGHALLAVPGLTFDDTVQPDTLTHLALGIVANVRGQVAGDGRIDWTAETVTSSGRFSSDGLDFAAAFGPTKGVAGTIVFTDLLGLVTAPDQRLAIGSINPGIEVDNGTLSYELHPDNLLVINGVEWNFLDGKMRMLPTRMTLGAAEVRRYVLEVEGISAARFIEKMDLGNLAATGHFDGRLPLVFDEDGGRIEHGSLASRPPGGNVAYVGELTYSDLSTMGNFAFSALRSLDFRSMRIEMDGSLAGELVSRIRFEGIGQGKGSKRNFVTRQLARLPFRFNVNLRAPFYALITNFKALYDTGYVRDPRDAGLLDAKGKPREGGKPQIPASPSFPQQGIQPPVSEKRQ